MTLDYARFNHRMALYVMRGAFTDYVKQQTAAEMAIEAVDTLTALSSLGKMREVCLAACAGIDAQERAGNLPRSQAKGWVEVERLRRLSGSGA